MPLNRTQISQLYVSIFGRASEGAGSAYWMNDQTNMTEAAETMLTTDAAVEYFGNTIQDNHAFISFIYKNTLGKIETADPDGISYWVTELENGKSKGEVVNALINATMDSTHVGSPAQKTFIHKVEISDYTAESIENFISFSLFSSFIDGLTDSDISVSTAKSIVDGYADALLPHDQVSLPASLDLTWVSDQLMNQAPFNGIGLVSVENSYGSFTGTGFLITPEHVLTNAHMILDELGNSSANDQITFYPGQNGISADVTAYTWEQAWWETSFDNASLYADWPNNDLAVFKLTEPVEETSAWFQPLKSNENELEGLNVVSAGYAGENIQQETEETLEKDEYQWKIFGTIDDYLFDGGALDLSESMLSTAGSSGSPVFYEENGTYYCVGVYAGVYGDDPVAATFDAESFNWLMGILQEDGYYSDYLLNIV